MLADQRDSHLQGPIILVGHSCGGRYALFTVQQLARWNIPVALLVCIDVAIPFTVAANVKRAIHIYRITSSRAVQDYVVTEILEAFSSRQRVVTAA